MIETGTPLRLLRNGRGHVLRVPSGFEWEGDDVIVRKEGFRLIVEPTHKGRLVELLERLKPLDEPFPEIDDDLPPLDEVRI